MTELKTSAFFDMSHTVAAEYLQRFEFPWEALAGIKEFIIELGARLPKDEFYSPSENVWISKGAKVAPSASINPPCIICEGAEVRHCAFIRGSALIGDNCVVGNSTELKNAILFDNVQVPHFNYVGDSILGYKTHLGAGAVTSNVKSNKSLVAVKGETHIQTELKKFGAMVGDFVEVGCNSVLNPGTIIGRNSNIYPASCVRGVVAENSIWKTGGVIVKKEKV